MITKRIQITSSVHNSKCHKVKVCLYLWRPLWESWNKTTTMQNNTKLFVHWVYLNSTHPLSAVSSGFGRAGRRQQGKPDWSPFFKLFWEKSEALPFQHQISSIQYVWGPPQSLLPSGWHSDAQTSTGFSVHHNGLHGTKFVTPLQEREQIHGQRTKDIDRNMFQRQKHRQWNLDRPDGCTNRIPYTADPLANLMHYSSVFVKSVPRYLNFIHTHFVQVYAKSEKSAFFCLLDFKAALAANNSS